MVFYHHFNLLMDRSPSFGSTSCNSDALFRLALAAASDLKSLTSLHNVTRRSVLQKVRDRTFNVLSLLVNTRFQVLFHSPPGVLFTFPSRYYALSVTGSYLALEGGPPCFPPDSSCPVVLWILTACFGFRVRDSYPLRSRFPTSSAILNNASCQSTTPIDRSQSVWPLPLSLAATDGISVDFFSSRYLDVSVPGVSLV